MKGNIINKRCLALMLAMVIMLSGFYSAGGAEKAYAAETWIEITDAAGLNAIRSNLSANYRLTADIDLNGASWTPLGTVAAPFLGTLDGNGKIIRNFTINNTAVENQGLFSVIGASGSVRNLNITEATITAGNYTGILAGTNNGTISVCSAQGSVTGRDYVGGLVGSNAGQVFNSFASAFVSGNDYMGGLAGSNSGTVDRSYSSSQIQSSLFNNYLQFDGVNDYILIPHHASYATDSFTLEAWFQWDRVGTNDIQFILGKGSTGADLNQFEIHTGGGAGCTNWLRFIPIPPLPNGDSWIDVKNVLQPGWFHVAAVYDYAHDQARVYINGVAQELWQNGTSAGTTASLPRDANPLSGNTNAFNIGRRTDNTFYFQGKISDVRFWNIARTAEQINADKNKKLNGTEDHLIGYWRLDEADGTLADDSTATGNDGTLMNGITRVKEPAASHKGGLVGDNTGTVTNSYYDKEISGQEDNTGKGVPKLTAEMKQEATFNTGVPATAWDFTAIWRIVPGTNNGYPYLLMPKVITGFNFAGLTPAVNGVINEGAKTIALTVPYETNVTALVPTITYTGASVSPNTGVANNFSTAPVNYTVTAADGSTQNYAVTVSKAPPSNIATVTSGSYTVSAGGTAAETITNVPFGTSKADFLAAITKGQAYQTWNDTNIGDYVVSGNTLIVTAQDGTTVVTYTITVNASQFAGGYGTAAQPYQITKLEHLDRIRNFLDKHFILMNDLDFGTTSGSVADYLDIANKPTWTTGQGWVPIGTSGSQFTGSFNGNSHKITGLMINYPMGVDKGLFGYIGAGAEIKNGSLQNVNITANQYVGGLAAINSGTITNFSTTGTVSGDINEIGGLVGRNSGTVSTSYSTASVSGPNVVGGLVGINMSGGSVNNSYATGTVSATNPGSGYAGGLVGLCLDNTARITNSYATGSVSGTRSAGLVGGDNGTVTNSFYDSITSGKSDTAKGTPKTTILMKTQGTYTGWDFGTVWNIVNTETHYSYPYLRNNPQDPLPGHRVRVPLPTVTNFSLAGLTPLVASTINEAAKTIVLNVPAGTNVTALVPTIVHTGVSITPASGAAQDFTNSVTYTATSEDGGTQAYTVLSPIATVTSGTYSVSAAAGGAGTISNVPFATSKAHFLAALTKGQANQTWNDMNIADPVVSGNTLVVTAQDGTAAVTYTVTVNPLPTITGFSFAGLTPVVNGIVNEGAKAIALSVPSGTDVTALVPTITHTGASVTPASGTVQNFTAPVTYTVTATDGGIQAYTVTVTVAAPESAGSNDTSSSTNNSAISVMLNGTPQNAGTASTETRSGQTVTTITVNYQQLESKLQNAENGAVVTLVSNTNSDRTNAELNGQMVKTMESREAVIEIKAGTTSYTVPAGEINIDAVSEQLGQGVGLSDIKVNINIAEPPADTVKIVEDTANKNNYQIVVKPVEFNITCTYGDKTVEVSKFNGYVERTIAIPEGIEPSKITTGVVLNADGTFSHVPTTIVIIGGKYYAKINSLTNSTYSVIYNPQEFKDVADHWAKEDLNDLGSRMVISADAEGNFAPYRQAARAEFAEMIVKALGIQPGTAKNIFSDVKLTDWHSPYINSAYEYGIVAGVGNGRFAPSASITREQVMAMMANAMKVTGLKVDFQEGEIQRLLAEYKDATKASEWAKASIAACVKSGIVSGKGNMRLAPQDEITRAEVAVMVKRLLQKSGLI